MRTARSATRSLTWPARSCSDCATMTRWRGRSWWPSRVSGPTERTGTAPPRRTNWDAGTNKVYCGVSGAEDAVEPRVAEGAGRVVPAYQRDEVVESLVPLPKVRVPEQPGEFAPVR